MQFQKVSQDYQTGYPHRRRSTTLEGIINTFDWLLVAFILALLFRAFAVEAFQIPTGSMAETLKGSHWHMRCLRCGYPYDLGGDSGILGRPQCPNCGYFQPTEVIAQQAYGDRIFVNKCIYQFSDPQRWDVVVFKNPPKPKENYIKRLIGLPGETVEIIDGDIYINGKIVRKPLNVQREQWMCIYDNDYQPLNAQERFNEEIQQGNDLENIPWTHPFSNEPGSQWNLNAEGPSVFELDVPGEEIHRLVYTPQRPGEFRASYAYNDRFLNTNQPICSDLMIRFWLEPQGEEGHVGAKLEKQGIQYSARFDFFGQLVLEKIDRDETKTILRRIAIDPMNQLEGFWFEFANVDQRLVVRYGPYRFSIDLDGQESEQRIAKQKIERNPSVGLFGSGRLKLRHIGLYRDIYYISQGILRAREGNGFKLEKGEYFVCGDNSPNSSDGRLWATEGIGNLGRRFRSGIVPRQFMMGKAFFIYWSDAFRPRPNTMPVIPNLDQLQVIYGGSEQMY